MNRLTKLFPRMTVTFIANSEPVVLSADSIVYSPVSTATAPRMLVGYVQCVINIIIDVIVIDLISDYLDKDLCKRIVKPQYKCKKWNGFSVLEKKEISFWRCPVVRPYIW